MAPISLIKKEKNNPCVVSKQAELEVRVDRLLIQDQGLWSNLWEGGEQEIKLLSAVSDGLADGLYHLELGVFPVRGKEAIGFGPAGFAIYRNPRGILPRYLDIHLAVLEDDSGIRDGAQLLQAVKTRPAFGRMASALAGRLAHPAAAVGLRVADTLLDLALEVLAANRDDLWLRAMTTLNRAVDGFEREIYFKRPGKVELWGRALVA